MMLRGQVTRTAIVAHRKIDPSQAVRNAMPALCSPPCKNVIAIKYPNKKPTINYHVRFSWGGEKDRQLANLWIGYRVLILSTAMAALTAFPATSLFAPRVQKTHAKRASVVTKAGKYDDELLETAVSSFPERPKLCGITRSRCRSVTLPSIRSSAHAFSSNFSCRPR